MDTDTVRTVFARVERREEGNSEHHEYESQSFGFQVPARKTPTRAGGEKHGVEDLSPEHRQIVSDCGD